MYLVPIAWIYVTLMMAIVEATGSNGTVLGAIITFLLYGVLPVALVMYLLGTPSRRRAQRAREREAELPDIDSDTGLQPDAGRHAATATEDEVVPPVGKES